jgi:hypothetical protein
MMPMMSDTLLQTFDTFHKKGCQARSIIIRDGRRVANRTFFRAEPEWTLL